ALAFRPSRISRLAAAPVTAVAVVLIFVGSTTFRDRFVEDPFLAPAPAINVTTLRGDVLAEFTVPMDAAGLWLSPGGRYVALSTEDWHQQLAIDAGARSGGLTTIGAVTDASPAY